METHEHHGRPAILQVWEILSLSLIEGPHTVYMIVDLIELAGIVSMVSTLLLYKI